MENLDTKYCLHECIINKVEIVGSKILLYIYDGLYKIGIENPIKVQKRCNISISVDDLKKESVWEHVDITVYSKNAKKNISFSKFCKMVYKNKFRIYLDFYSNFAKGLLLKGFSNKREVELLITEIEKIEINEN